MTSFGLVPVVLLAIGAALVAGGIRTRLAGERVPRHWLAVTGRVIDADRPQRIEYRTGRGRRFELRTDLDRTFVLGEEVVVAVDPVDSSRARIVDADQARDSVSTLLLACGAAFLVAGVLGAVAFA